MEATRTAPAGRGRVAFISEGNVGRSKASPHSRRKLRDRPRPVGRKPWDKNMRFGIYCEIQTPPGKSHYDMIWEIMRQIEHADECGFDNVLDHRPPLLQKFSISANPLAMFAGGTGRTSHLASHGAPHAAPGEIPWRLAGMIAQKRTFSPMAAWSAGRGHAWLFGPPCRWRRAVHAMTRPSKFELVFPGKVFLTRASITT
jgi:hypothetical protein